MQSQDTRSSRFSRVHRGLDPLQSRRADDARYDRIADHIAGRPFDTERAGQLLSRRVWGDLTNLRRDDGKGARRSLRGAISRQDFVDIGRADFRIDG